MDDGCGSALTDPAGAIEDRLMTVPKMPLPSRWSPQSGTELRLVHRGLEGPMADAHSGGWANYLCRLATRAEGGDPGRDLLAAGRVPPRAELGLA